MNEEIKDKNAQRTGFPWGAMWLFVATVIAIASYELIAGPTEFSDLGDPGTLVVIGVFGVVLGSLTAIVGMFISYALTKFPTQWLAKQDNVYSYDIWSALFYTSAISAVMTFILEQFNMHTNLVLTSLAGIATTALFLFFYFSGEEKPANVKRAITIVELAWLVLGLALSFALYMFAGDLIV